MEAVPASVVALATVVAPFDPSCGLSEDGTPYWQARPGIAPVKAEFVLWEKLRVARAAMTEEAADRDDAAEGRGKDTTTAKPNRLRNEEDAAAKAAAREPIVASTSTLVSPFADAADAGWTKRPRTEGTDEVIEAAVTVNEGEPAAKKVRLSGAQKKQLRRDAENVIWNHKKDAQVAAKAAKAAAGDVEGAGQGKKKERGQNKGRTFDRHAGETEIRLCSNTSAGKQCDRLAAGNCRWSHDLIAFLAQRLKDVQIQTPATDNDLSLISPLDRLCPAFLELGECVQGYRCSFGLSHMVQVAPGTGDEGSDWKLVVDAEKVARLQATRGSGLSEIREKGEMNVINMTQIKAIRGQGASREDRFPLSTEYLASIGEPLELREVGNSRGGANQKKVDLKKPAVYVVKEFEDDDDPLHPIVSTSAAVDVDADPSRNFVPDLAPIRAGEKKSLDFRGKLYLAPLTTVGNLPFRRLCNTLGNDITCSEMGLSQEFLAGNGNEWSLTRRHPSEKLFGIQICGSRPQALVPAAEAIVKSCDIDFLDVNCGCPIDLVFNKGAGSALLQHATKLGKSLTGMSKVLGEIPLTIKIRNGITNSSPVAHKLVTKMQTQWGVSAVTLHGRSRQQRYKTKADYAYIAQVARTLRETASDAGLKPIPIFGNGDAYDYRTYYENMEASGVDGIMIARGALVKPWIFTEIKERRDWDISARERLDMLGQLATYGIEHWGSDQMGLNTTRRFLCEALSFQHRYVPVGLLDHLPANLNDRPFAYEGRNDLETLLASDQSSDWVKVTEMFLGPTPDAWSFQPKHKASASESTEVQG